MSVCIGASATGARTYTATASQGLLYMVEAVYNASGLGLPIVMTVANRAIGSPINIWNDHSDAMSQRDSGWIQLYAESNQEALDLHIQAFRLAEELSLPVMVCMDGFVLTHAVERVDVPTQEQVDAYLPPFEPRQVLDPDDPMTIGAMVGPEAFTEVRYLMHAKQMQALDVIPRVAGEFAAAFGRDSGGLVRGYRIADAETIVVALGSVLGTVEDVVDELRDEGLRSARSGAVLPAVPVRRGPRGTRRRAGSSSWKGLRRRRRRDRRPNVRMASPASGAGCTRHRRPRRPPGHKCGAARDDRRRVAGRLEPLTFLDLDRELVERELRRGAKPRSGPHAENILREIGIVAGGRTESACRAKVKFDRSGRSPSATGCSTRRTAPSSPTRDRANTLTSGHRACQGCGEALGARYVARRRDARDRRPARRGRTRPGASRSSPRPTPRRRGSCRGSTRCSATRRRSRPGSPPR